MTNKESRSIRVAAVQIESRNGAVSANLDHAASFVDQAVQRGARLVLLPELMPAGYIFSKSIWDGAEPTDGPTVNWLRRTSRSLRIWLGTSYLEAAGEHFYNTFVLTAPDGTETGRVRKQTPAVFEAYFFRGERGPHVIESDLGRIGAGICWENMMAYIPRIMREETVDIMLMPHSAPTIEQNFLFPRRQAGYYDGVLRELAARYARLLGIPVIMANKSGEWKSPLPGLPFRQDSSFPGLSTIVDSDGAIKAQMGKEEGVIVEDVTLDPCRKTESRVADCGRWAWKVPWWMNFTVPIEAAGALRYGVSVERRRKARAVSCGTGGGER